VATAGRNGWPATTPDVKFLGVALLDRSGRVREAPAVVLEHLDQGGEAAGRALARAVRPTKKSRGYRDVALRVPGATLHLRVFASDGDEVLAFVGRSEPRPRRLDLSALTPREREVAALVARGSDARTARRLGIAVSTVRWHLTNIYHALGLPNRAALVAALEAPEALETLEAGRARALSLPAPAATPPAPRRRRASSRPAASAPR
jgi:DNA-binding CsgD family transcriptional regulator